MLKKLQSILLVAVMLFALVSPVSNAAVGGAYVFSFVDDGSTGVNVYYSVNGSTSLGTIASGATIRLDADDVGSIAFYVAVKAGYYAPSLSIGFTSANQIGEFFELGDTTALTDFRTGRTVSYVAANAAAAALGCTKEFHYSQFSQNASPSLQIRSFKITAQTGTGTSFDVNYNANGGTGTMTDPNSPYEGGDRVTVLANAFTRGGYSFTGWNTRADGYGTSYAAGSRFYINSDVTLYAQWQRNWGASYTVTYNANGGTGTMTDPNSPYASGSTVTVLDNAFTRSGYRFVGWNTRSNGNGRDYDPAQTFSISGNVTLYAQWERVVTYTVTYNSNGGAGTMTDANSPYTSGSSVTVLDNAFTRGGYRFTGWNTRSNGSGRAYAADDTFRITRNTTLYAQWERAVTYIVSYNANGGSGTMTDANSPYFTGNTVTVLGNGFTAPSNRHFTGWNTRANGSGTSYAAGATFTINSNVTLYAQWAFNPQYTVTYNANGGTGTMTDANSPYYSGNTVTVLGNGFTAPANKHFTGWNTSANGSGTAYAAGATFTINSNVTLYAQWAFNPQYTVTYNANGGSGTMTDANSPYFTGSTVTVLGNGFTAPANKYFTGWNTNANGSGTAYVPGATFVISGNVTLYAQWATKTAVNILPDSGEVFYNGADHSITTYKISGLDLTTYRVNGVAVSGSGKNANSYPVTVTSKLADISIMLNGVDVTERFSITFGEGTLLIKPVAITLAPDNNSKPYDGGNLSPVAYRIVSGAFIGTEGIASVTYNSVGPNANTYSGTIARYNLKANTLASNYAISLNTCVLTISPRSIGIKADSDSKQYNGVPLTANGYKITSGTFVGDEGFKTVTVTGSQLDVGTSANEITNWTFKAGTLAGNYIITPADGLLEVTKNLSVITITPNDAERAYNGLPLSAPGCTFTQGIIPATEELTAVITTSITDVSRVDNVVDSYKIMRGEVDVTDFYTVVTGKGSLEVTPVSIGIKADSDSKQYNGVPLTANGYKITSGAFVGDEGFESVTVTGSQLDVGTSANEIADWVLKSNTLAKNYVIVPEEGLLEVTKNLSVITITPNDAERAYNGLPLSAPGCTFTQGIIPATEELTAVITTSITDVSRVDNVVDSYKIMRGEVDVTDFYTVVTGKGSLEVTPVSIGIKADSDSKQYNGVPLTANGYKITSGAFVGDEGFESVTVIGSQLDVGSSANEIADWVLKSNTLAQNYVIIPEEGLLEVTKNLEPILIAPSGATRVYNGLPLSAPGYTFTQGIIPATEELTAVITTSITDVSSVDNVVDSYKIMRGEVDVTDFYTITTTTGTLSVTPRTVYAYAPGATAVYNGLAHTVSGVDRVTNLVGGHVLTGLDSGATLTDVGSVRVELTGTPVIRTAGGALVTRNYTVVRVPATLTVSPIDAVIRVASFEKLIETEDPSFTATVEGELNAGDIVYTLSREAGEDVGNYEITASYTPNPNYNVTVVAGNLSIFEVIDPGENPGGDGSSWALVNLILTVLTAAGMALMLIGYFTKRRDWLRFVSLVPAVGAVVAFFLTENMNAPMVYTDKWTILMAVIAVAQLVVYFLVKKDKDDDKKNKQDKKAAANA